MTLPVGVSQRDIAEHLGISVSTVSRTLSDNGRVSMLTREAVQRAIQEITARNQPAVERALPLMIGITHSHSYNGLQNHDREPVLEQVLEGVEVACRRNDAVPYPWQQSHLLVTAEADPFFDRVSGVIMSGGEVDLDVVAAIARRGKPIVVIGGYLSGSSIPSVSADNFQGLYLATQYLLDLGHRRITLINGPNTTYTSTEKRAGYLTALADAGLSHESELLIARDDLTGLTDGAAEELTHSVLSLPHPPTALLFATDKMARAGYRVCQKHGLSIPEDISIIGFHDDDAAFAYPPLTTVRVNRFDWGIAAVEELIRILEGHPSRTSRLLMPVELVVRESTGPYKYSSYALLTSNEVKSHG